MNLNKYPKMQRLQNDTIPRFWHYLKKNIPKTYNRKKKKKEFPSDKVGFCFCNPSYCIISFTSCFVKIYDNSQLRLYCFYKIIQNFLQKFIV